MVARSLLASSKQTLSSLLSLSLSTPPSLSLYRLRPLFAIAANVRHQCPPAITARGFSTRQTTSSLKDTSPNWSNRPPKETILLDGCDFEHWLVVMEKPEDEPTRDEIIDSYIKTLAMVVGSEEEARMKIYSVSTRCYFAFGALVSEELSYKLKELPRVRWVLPDSYLDVRNKDYGGEPFINGQAVPYDPKYHAEWTLRIRKVDRQRNFERRRVNTQNMGDRGMYNPGPNMGVVPPSNSGGVPNWGGTPNKMGGGVPPSNIGGVPNMGGTPHGTMGVGPVVGTQPRYMGGQPPNYMGGSDNMRGVPPNMGGMPPNNMGWAHNNVPNFQQINGPNNGGMPYEAGPGPNRDYQNTPHPNMAGGITYQSQDMPGRDTPTLPNYQ